MAIMNGILGNVVNYGSPDYQRNVSLAEQQEILKRERLMREGYRPNAAERDVALQAFAEKMAKMPRPVLLLLLLVLELVHGEGQH